MPAAAAKPSKEYRDGQTRLTTLAICLSAGWHALRACFEMWVPLALPVTFAPWATALAEPVAPKITLCCISKHVLRSAAGRATRYPLRHPGSANCLVPAAFVV
jgi:hypothetical protein